MWDLALCSCTNRLLSFHFWKADSAARFKVATSQPSLLSWIPSPNVQELLVTGHVRVLIGLGWFFGGRGSPLGFTLQYFCTSANFRVSWSLRLCSTSCFDVHNPVLALSLLVLGIWAISDDGLHHHSSFKWSKLFTLIYGVIILTVNLNMNINPHCWN